MAELKECPFCGGQAKLRKKNRTIIDRETKRNCYVYCLNCDARAERFVYDDSHEAGYFHQKAVDAWNTRAKL